MAFMQLFHRVHVGWCMPQLYVLGNLLSKNTNEISSRAQKALAWKRILANTCVACSQTLYFLFKVRRVIKYKPQGIYWPPAQGDSGGGFFFIALAARSRALAAVFEKNVRPQETQAWNISVGEHRHCCVTLYSYFEKGCRKKSARDNPER